MIAFIYYSREANGVEPIRKMLPITPSTYHYHVAKRRDPSRMSDRLQPDTPLKPVVALVFAENFG